jgi:energy-coupling factor transport system ATP-binding protein
MFAIGMIGFLAVFGAFTAVLIYGGLMNPAAAMMMSSETLKLETLLACYITGLPMDLVHAFGAAIFLMIAAEPMLEKMDRIKVKYGIAD